MIKNPSLTPKLENLILDHWRASWTVQRILAELQFSHGNLGITSTMIYNLIDRAKKRGDIRATTRRKYAVTVRST